MSTYQDVTKRVRAMIGDAANHYADDNYLLTFVNIAQGQLVSELTARGIREAMSHTSMLIPAGTSRIERWPAVPTMPNEIASSDSFAISPPPAGWESLVGTDPSVSSGISDPDGTTLAKRWSFAADSTRTLYAAGAVVAPALVYFGGSSVWFRSADATAPLPARIRAGIADDNGPIEETMVARDVAVTTEWQRQFVPFEGKVITATPVGSLRRCLEIRFTAASPTTLDVFRAVIRPTYADTDDVQTAGVASTAGRIPTIPAGLVTPDKLMERTPGSNGAWTPLYGPAPLRATTTAQMFGRFDWRNGGLDLPALTVDRELYMEYWETLPDGELGTNVLEEELPLTASLEPLAAITAGIVSQSRDQHTAAERFGVMQAGGGFSGTAGGLVTNLVATFQKAQQSAPVRRPPYFGNVRYPGYNGRVIGAWPGGSS